jgi:hypothetical protein
MKTDYNKSRTVSGTQEIQYISSDYIRTVFYTGVPVLTETVLYFMVINASTTYLTSAATVP